MSTGVEYMTGSLTRLGSPRQSRIGETLPFAAPADGAIAASVGPARAHLGPQPPALDVSKRQQRLIRLAGADSLSNVFARDAPCRLDAPHSLQDAEEEVSFEHRAASAFS